MTPATTDEEYVVLVAEMDDVSIVAYGGFKIPPFKPPLGRARLLLPDSVSKAKRFHPRDVISVGLSPSPRGTPFVI